MQERAATEGKVAACFRIHSFIACDEKRDWDASQQAFLQVLYKPALLAKIPSIFFKPCLCCTY